MDEDFFTAVSVKTKVTWVASYYRSDTVEWEISGRLGVHVLPRGVFAQETAVLLQ
jgi:hypothetical protein